MSDEPYNISLMASNTTHIGIPITKPETEQELLKRCQIMTGQTLLELALTCQQSIPKSFHHSKGWVGQLIESCLGADGTNQAQPDFAHLGIELKTIPLNANKQPRESTYVCTAPLENHNTRGLHPETWATSRVRHKLARVLWVPVEADPKIPIPNRRIGSPLLWSLPVALEVVLQQDWEELIEMLHCGQIAHISAKQGVYLQIRPKAAHSRVLIPTLDENADSVWVNPKGFYLRTSFTKEILHAHYCIV